ncbi:MAG: hypothetical protein U9N45_05285 [Gemmatimonadota bacterium]|nr:hypothetical protein [Gemmatimonadota bacterium]
MSAELERLNKRRKALRAIERIKESPERVFLINYSCECFDHWETVRTPRITAIAVHNLDSGPAAFFSIRKEAERLDIPLEEIDSRYDELEKAMLGEYFHFIRSRDDSIFLRWDRGGVRYGFAVLEQRYIELGGKPYSLDRSRKYNLSRALMHIYGQRYIHHPRLENLIKKNGISSEGFLDRKLEIEAFNNKKYDELHISAQRKAEALAGIFRLTADRSLETDARIGDIYGFSPGIFVEIAKSLWKDRAVRFIIKLAGVIALIYVIFRALHIIF